MYYLLTQAIGFVGLVAFILSFQCKSSKRLILLFLYSNVCYAIQFIMLGGYSAGMTGMTAALNNVVQYHAGKKWADWIGWRPVFCGLYVVAMVVTWNGWLSLLPCVASIVGNLVMWSQNGRLIRLSRLFIVSPCWLIYGACMGSLVGIVGQLLSIGSVLISIRRYGLKELDQVS